MPHDAHELFRYLGGARGVGLWEPPKKPTDTRPGRVQILDAAGRLVRELDAPVPAPAQASVDPYANLYTLTGRVRFPPELGATNPERFQ